MAQALSDNEVTRYARQLILPEIGDEGQDALKATRLAIIGAGGLGTPALIMAASAGFGHITIIDDDAIELTNLNRQFLYHETDAGSAKAVIAAKAAQAQNPHITVTALEQRFDANSAAQITATHDLIIDASDNPETRYLANRAAYEAQCALIFVSAIRFEGQLALFAPPAQGTPALACYECLFPQPDITSGATSAIPNCATVGIAGPVTAIMGSLAVLEALKFVTKTSQNTGQNTGQNSTSLAGRLMLFDGLSCHSDLIKTKRDKNCPVCSSS